eukprot:SM000456S16098  [mRNA]  locus=s456:18822:20412:+ [translate_table: standard]
MENLYSKKRGLEDNCYSAEQHLLLLLESSLNEARQQEVQINSSEDLTTAGGLLVAVDKFLSTGEKSSTLS